MATSFLIVLDWFVHAEVCPESQRSDEKCYLRAVALKIHPLHHIPFKSTSDCFEDASGVCHPTASQLSSRCSAGMALEMKIRTLPYQVQSCLGSWNFIGVSFYMGIYYICIF